MSKAKENKILSGIVFTLLIMLLLAVGAIAFMPLVTKAENYGYAQPYSNNFVDTFYDSDYGGSSTAKNPVPKIYYVDPNSTTARNVGMQVTISGANFIPDSRARFDNLSRSTIYKNAGKLTINLLASDLSTPGVHSITVVNPGPGGGISNVEYLTIERASSGAVLGASTTRNSANTIYYNNSDYNYDGPVNEDADQIRNLTANTLFGAGNIFPTSLVGWLALAIVILLVAIIIRKIFGLEHKYHSTPLKHS